MTHEAHFISVARFVERRARVRQDKSLARLQFHTDVSMYQATQQAERS